MSGHLLLDGAALAVSLFNAFLLTWLGFTVLINAERRSWGMILAAGGLLAGALFFAGHSLVLVQGASWLLAGLAAWWRAGWLPVIAAPYAWYLLMLWYGGYWDDPASELRRRQRHWLWISAVYALLVCVLSILANPLPSLPPRAGGLPGNALAAGDIPALLLVYPPFILLCLGLALDALLRPAPSHRILGEMARRRARPWLVEASLTLVLVGLVVSGLFSWLSWALAQHPDIPDLILSFPIMFSLFDLLLAALLMGSTLLLGQAIASYEIFSGKTLPRRGFLRQWQQMVGIAATFSVTAAGCITIQAPWIVTLLVLLVLAALSFAWLGWQSFSERQRQARQLRVLLASQGVFQHILDPSPEGQPAGLQDASFAMFCSEILGARRASLVPLGSLAALGIAPLHFPAGASSQAPLAEILAGLDSPETAGLPLSPERCSGLVWAAPLWNERGLEGLLLLGEKSDGGVYSLEEIELARAGGERLADILASAEMARRLVSLQRKRLVENGILDRRARHTLHDEILPRLHTAILQMAALPGTDLPASQEVSSQLVEVHRQLSDLLRTLPRSAPPDLARLGLVGALQRVISDELPGSFDHVLWEVGPEAQQRAKSLPALVAEVVFYAGREAMRNAAHHARPAGSSEPLELRVVVDWRSGLVLRIEDNGVGLPPPGLNAPAAGQGLALHSTMMAVINGSLSLESMPREYTRVTLSLPAEALELWKIEETGSLR
jgi:signal transduction histidine kinase